MNEIRKGQIALLFVKYQLCEKGVRLTPNFRREIGNGAKTIGVPIEEAMEFVESIIREMVEETFRTSVEPGPGCLGHDWRRKEGKRQFFESLPDRTKG